MKDAIKMKKTFKDIEPLTFNAYNPDIGKQVQDLEEIVKTEFGRNGEKNSEYISFTQLRGLYDKIKQCNGIAATKILYPKVIYMAARQNKEQGKKLVMQIASFLKAIESDDDLKTFKKFMEAIVAYQKYYYPSKN